MKQIIILSLAISFSCCFCNTNTKSANYIDTNCQLDKPTFVVDTPQGPYYYRTIVTNDYLSLKQINYPSDTFFLRVLTGTKKEFKVFEFSFVNSKSSFKKYNFTIDTFFQKIVFDKQKDSNSKFLTVFDPYHKGKDFSEQLKLNSILELPDSQKLPGYDDEQGSGVLIEYSNRCIYKLIRYMNLFTESNKFPEAKKVTNFMAYLKEEFDF